jgi:predicted O-methyltransferase YrrM
MDDQPTHIPMPVLVAQQTSTNIGFAMSCDDRTGALLRTLAAAKPGGRLLELGTGTGVGAAWMLAGMDATATLVTVEAEWTTATVARQLLAADPRVQLHVADAAEWLVTYTGPPFDVAYIDCRPGKFTHRDLLWPHLTPGALYLGDDLLPQPTWPEDHQPRVDAFLAEIGDEPQLVTTLLDWSSGLVLAAFRGPVSTLAL